MSAVTKPVTTPDMRDAIGAAGLTPPVEIISDEEVHRFSSNGRRGDDAGWYVAFSDGLGGVFGCHRLGIRRTWISKDAQSLSPAERERNRQRCAQLRKERDAAEQSRHAEARQLASTLWDRAQPADLAHTYLRSKRIAPYDSRQLGECLVLPLTTIDDTLQGLQYIRPAGKKHFLPGTEKRGAFYRIRGDCNAFIVEGFATGATIHEATGATVFVAFDAGNLVHVAQAIAQTPEKTGAAVVAIAADNDAHGVGLKKAQDAASVLRVPVVIPRDLGDWNDAARRHNLEYVRDQIEAKLMPQQTDSPLQRLDAVCTKWLGSHFDHHVMHAVIACAAVNYLDGDPVWLMVVGAPGSGKTEVITALRDVPGCQIISSIASEGALLSGTAKKERASTATGGVLKGFTRGLLVPKDFTTILSMDRNVRSAVLAALREIYDGRWQRLLGSDGGQVLTWEGRLIIIAACTTAWDQAHAVIGSLGDRFVLIRVDSADPDRRSGSGHQAVRNIGHEAEMRAELSAAVRQVIDAIPPEARPELSSDEIVLLLDLADLVTIARTAIITDQRGEPLDAHAPESPNRFGKELCQLVRGALAIGLHREEAMAVAVRCARDSIPPMRLACLGALLSEGNRSVGELYHVLQKPRTTVDRTLQALHMIGLVSADTTTSPWHYSLSTDVKRERLALLALSGDVSRDTPSDILPGFVSKDTPSPNLPNTTCSYFSGQRQDYSQSADDGERPACTERKQSPAAAAPGVTADHIREEF